MDIYKVMLNAIVQPICGIEFERLRDMTKSLQDSDPDSTNYATGEMLLRAKTYIELTLTLAHEEGNEDAAKILAALRHTTL